LPNGTLGILCKQIFPIIVEYAETHEPTYTFDHYAAALDLLDQLCRQFRNKAQQVVNELLVRLHRTTLLITSHSFNNL
jgi:glycyl-tRNA synthetase alpha subunit